MWFKLQQSILKEFKLLFRDIGGLLTLFVMPIVLVVLITSIQDSSFQSKTATKIPVLWLDQDQDSLSFQIKKEWESSENFLLVDTYQNQPMTEQIVRDLVFKGSYQMGIVLPENLTTQLQIKVRQNVDNLLEEMGMNTTFYEKQEIHPQEIQLYFDPATQISFKNEIKNSMDKMILQLENQSIYQALEHQLGASVSTDDNSVISFKEIVPLQNEKEVLPNSAQHNVPAWTLFAVFFIAIPLSINIVKEKSQGTYLRILSSPTSLRVLYLGKIITYLLICLLQFYAILLVSLWVFPLIDLPPLTFTFTQFLWMSLVTLGAGFAAICMAILIGVISKTQEQSAPFGATITVILAAIGGVWVPVFIMSSWMQMLSKISPMHWALRAYYDILLRNGSLIDILPQILFLILFAIVLLSIAWIYDKKKRTV